MNAATLFLLVLAAGISSQWVSWRVGIPAIVVLIATGLVLGPVTGVVQMGVGNKDVAELIGLGVSIILFEGGMNLKLGELRRTGPGIRRLTVLGPPLAWGFGTLAAHYVAGLSWPVAMVLGAILVVTGPTVIGPLLRQARLDNGASSLLKWEGIVNDPVGVLLAVLTFQYLTLPDTGLGKTALALASAIGVAVVLGGLGGYATGWLYRRGAVPEHLKAPLLIVLVPVIFWVSNQVQHEAGLLSVTMMGLVMGNMKLVEREALQESLENLTVLLLSVLFIVIPAQLQAEQLDLLDWRMAAFVLVVLFVVRPLTVGLATLGAPMRQSDKLLLGWIAPRGIVAAATAGLFGPALEAAGYPDAVKLMPMVFLVIMVTVLAHGFSIGRLARRLNLAAKDDNGLLIVGATRFTLALAETLKKLGQDVMVVDGAYARLKEARMQGVEVYYGEILSDHAEHHLEAQHLNHLLAATENDFYNALVCKAKGRSFGHHRTFQLGTDRSAEPELKRLTLQQRGYFAFDPGASFERLERLLGEGWSIGSRKLTDTHTWDAFAEGRGERGEAWFLLGAVTPAGLLRLYSTEQRFKLEAGWTALYFAPPADAATLTGDEAPAAPLPQPPGNAKGPAS
ncbi:MAG: cation:proton antiporter [Giesbergeria sp.]